MNYMTPLGLHHIMWEGHHYGPDPAYNKGHREDWRSTYYHRADAEGLGFDRSSSGSNAVEQYHPPVRDLFNDLATCPEKYLLWFHHVPWTHRMRSERTLWEELVWRYYQGVEEVNRMLETWRELKPHIDEQRYEDILNKLSTQLNTTVSTPHDTVENSSYLLNNFAKKATIYKNIIVFYKKFTLKNKIFS